MSEVSKILLIDDDPVVSEVLEKLLTTQGYEVTVGCSGAQALELLGSSTFDLILLDIGLPDMDGFEIMSHIRQTRPDALVIMITGDATIESAVEALKSGAYYYLRKPIQGTELLKTIKNALDHKHLENERRQAEDALRDSEKRFRTLVENSLVGICIIQDNRIIYQNPELKKLYGNFSKKPMNKLLGYVHPDDVEKVIGGYKSLLAGNSPSVETDFRFYPDAGRKDSEAEMRWVQCRASQIDYGARPAILVNTMDISQAKEMEHILRVKNKMISLGRVAAGIAHEIRNPLTGVNSYLYTLEDLLGEDEIDTEGIEMMRQIVDQLQAASNKIESVIKRVLDFSRPGAPAMALINLNHPLEEALNLSAVSLRKKEIQVELDVDSDLPKCYGDPHLIEQVILNLIDNAVKAMEKKNTAKRIALKSYSKNSNICIQVSDSGPGIPKSLREKIFDPFFTTETDGSGIGLAIAQRIVNDHNGSIRVSGNSWGGAEFTLEIPIEKRANRQ